MRLNQIYDAYKDRVHFLAVYIREAHPANGWQVPQNLDQNIIFDEPTTADERAEIASACQIGLDLRMPMAIDSIDNDVDGKYIGKPVRVFLIDAEGTIAYAGGRGPMEFSPDQWEQAIRKQIGAGDAA